MSSVLSSLRNYIASMAPHQKERLGGKLLLCSRTEIESLNGRVQALTDALKDAISTYGPKDEVLVTEERQEAWIAVLDQYGWKEAH